MVYKDRFVAVIKCGGKVLREKDDTVTLPFGSEYSLLLKNLESRIAVVKVTVDGQDAIDGSLILQPNSQCELEGFLKGYQVKNRFRFIQKTEEIVEHRGDRVDDGIIRVEYRFEKKVEYEEVIRHRRVITEPWRPYQPWPYWYPRCTGCYCDPCCCTRYYYGGTTIKTDDDSSVNYTFTNSDGETKVGTFNQSSSDVSLMSCSIGSEVKTAGFVTDQDVVQENAKPAEDEGITVPGSASGQSFNFGHHGELESNTHIIVLKLRGTKANKTVVEKPVTVKSRVNCPTCGTKSKSSADYCAKCGTALF